MKKILLALGAVLLLAPAAMAQRTFTSAPADSANRQKETVLIVTESNADAFFDKRESSKLSHSIKINPVVFAYGDLPVYLEHKLSNKLTAEVGAGMTYQNFLGELFYQLETGSYITTEYEMGYSLSGALRYYPAANSGLEGYYFAPEIRHRVYNMRAVEIDEEEINVKQRKTYTDFKLTFGYTESLDDNILIDFYSGLGLGNRVYKNEVSSEVIYRDYPEDNLTVINVNSRSKTVPVLALGVKFGFVF